MTDHSDERLAKAIGWTYFNETGGSGYWVRPQNGICVVPPNWASDPAKCATHLLPWLESMGEVSLNYDLNYGWRGRISGRYASDTKHVGAFAEAITALCHAVLDAQGANDD